MARGEPSPSAKGKAKAYAPSNRTSPRLAVLRAKASPSSPTPPPSPTSSLPQNTNFPSRSGRITTRGGPSTVAPKEKVVIEISSDTEPDPKLEDTIREVVEMDEDREEDPEEDSEEAPQDAKVEENPEEDPEEKQDEVEEHFRGEDDYKDYWQLEDSESENVLGDDPRFGNYDDLSDWQNAEPADSSARSYTRPPPANL
ncbi:hypothetical protein PIB30_074010 [Stylosanthes scabra]|uniref:Uncharacterized protein n=1 Tax=Stylosanthes scabra TaxID=79078 RepID=A0ABU6SPR0_9FABA|nr:hypothetical protein [Stylosanthes scabra]